jgi:hypothetical protein
METGESNPYLPPEAELTTAPDWSLPTDQRPVPFEDREREPRFWPRVWGMFRLLFTEPGELAERVPNTEGLGAPLRFALLLATPMMLLYLLLFGVLGGLMGFGLMASGQGEGGPPAWVFLLFGPGYAAFLAVFIAVSIPVGGTVLHLCLWMCGGTRQGRGLGQTLRAMGYYTAFHILGSLIPLVNIAVILGGPAFLGMALGRIHRTDTWRGIVAAYLPLVFCCCLYGLFIAVLLGARAFH